jgi:hypothetical protein
MKVQDVLNSNQALYALAQKQLPATAAYRVGKAINKARQVAQDFDRKRYAFISGLEGVTLSDDKKEFNIEGREAEVQEGIQKLLDEECTIEFPKIPLDMLKNIEIEPIHLAALDGWLIADLSEA